VQSGLDLHIRRGNVYTAPVVWPTPVPLRKKVTEEWSTFPVSVDVTACSLKRSVPVTMTSSPKQSSKPPDLELTVAAFRVFGLMLLERGARLSGSERAGLVTAHRHGEPE
jgi:hypothetical protein